MDETGVAAVADPLGGSWYVEALTDQIEADAEAIFARLLERGRRHHDQRHPARDRRRLLHRRDRRGGLRVPAALEKGDKHVVGVTDHVDSQDRPLEVLRVSHQVEVEQVACGLPASGDRDEPAVAASLARCAPRPVPTPIWCRS